MTILVNENAEEGTSEPEWQTIPSFADHHGLPLLAVFNWCEKNVGTEFCKEEEDA